MAVQPSNLCPTSRAQDSPGGVPWSAMRGHKRPRPDRGDNTWELIVNEGRDPLTGKRRSVSRLFRGTQTAADTALAQLVAEVTSTRTGPGTDAPLSELVTRWLDLVSDDLSPTTVAEYRRIAVKHLAPSIGQRPASQITTAELDAFYRDLSKRLAPASVRQIHAVIRRSFQQAVKWGWLAVNPAREATPPKVRKAELHPPSPEQVAALIVAADADDPAFGCLLRVAAATGARRGEVLGLRWPRVDLERGVIVIARSVVDAGEGIVEKDTKTHQARRVAVDAATVEALKAHRNRCAETAEVMGVELLSDGYVFPSERHPAGELPLHPDTVSKRYQRLAAVHAPGTRLHDLRHFTATQLLAAGVPVKTVSGRLGHGSAAMTLDVYAHAVPAADQAAADVIGGLLG